MIQHFGQFRWRDRGGRIKEAVSVTRGMLSAAFYGQLVSDSVALDMRKDLREMPKNEMGGGISLGLLTGVASKQSETRAESRYISTSL